MKEGTFEVDTVGVVGLGYVGLPLAVAAARAGLPTIGIDLNSAHLKLLNRGISPIKDVPSEVVRDLIGSQLEVTDDFSALVDANVVVICVPTPLRQSGDPDLSYVTSAVESISEHLRPGSLVILESTSYPGTTEEVVMPILQRRLPTLDSDFLLAFSPERIDPGNVSFSIPNTPRLVGGASEASGLAAQAFYRRFVDSVTLLSGTREAEMAKLLENTYRHVNIALVNELAIICRALGIDIWEAIRGASTKPYGFQPFYPGPGVGGHCIPIDPMYLDSQVKERLGFGVKFIDLAQQINRSMPDYVVSRVAEMLTSQGKTLEGSSVLLLGVAYKANISDTRETPAKRIAELLLELGSQVFFHDPYVDDFPQGTEGSLPRMEPWEKGLSRVDCFLVLQAHDEYLASSVLTQSSLGLDCTGRLKGFAGSVL